jgi:hypothetical protein
MIHLDWKRIALSCVLLLFGISGCTTERYFDGNGAEALVFQEIHRVDYVVKKRNETVEKMEQLIAISESLDKEAVYVVSYKSSTDRQLAEKAFKSFSSLSIDPSRIEYREVSNMIADVRIVVALRQLKTQTCKPAQLQNEIAQPDCFVETMRLKQVAYKSRLVGE